LLTEAHKLSRKMEEDGCASNEGTTFNVIIQGFLQQKNPSMARQLVKEMGFLGECSHQNLVEIIGNLSKKRGFSSNTTTRTLLKKLNFFTLIFTIYPNYFIRLLMFYNSEI
jgi:pentatricopeptide repeat protein